MASHSHQCSTMQTSSVNAGLLASRHQKRIGILTLHYVFNRGAVLQAYALSKLLGAEIVDHRYKTKQELYAGLSDVNTATRNFIAETLPLSSASFSANNFCDTHTEGYIETHYDAVVCGSDEIWKFDYTSRPSCLQYARTLLGDPRNTLWHYAASQRNAWSTPFPNVYWTKARVQRISFAASIGHSDVSTVPEAHCRLMAERLRGFSLIGVRDHATKRFIERIAPDVISRTHLVPDPVFTLEGEELDSLRWTGRVRDKLSNAGVNVSKQLAFTHFHQQIDHRTVSERFGLEDFEIVDLKKCDLTPLEWYVAISLCHCGVTDAMHPLIISLCCNVPCISIDPRNKSEELRCDFGLPTTEVMRDYVDQWPTHIPDQVAEYRGRAHDYANAVCDYIKG